MRRSHPANNKGFTFVELLVAFGLSALVLVFLTRLFSASLFGSTTQEMLSEMNQNARYTIRELGDVLMQAGADLQSMYVDEDKDTVIIPDGNTAVCSGFTIKINPRGGIHLIPQTNHTAICSIEVHDARGFRQTSTLQRIPGARSKLPIKFYTLQRIDTISNFIFYTPCDSFVAGDALCSFVKKRYFLSGANLCIDDPDLVIAENIDSLAISFLDKDGNLTASWPDMHSADLLVRTRTAHPDAKYNGYPDHYRRVTLTYRFRLRNKME
jgi:type II secretory pathway pseudopilin PulG